jgi:hypothetical protein
MVTRKRPCGCSNARPTEARGGIGGVEQGAGVPGENFAFLRDADAPRRPMQQARAKVPFELGEPGARDSSGQPEFPSRRRQVR